MPDNSTPVTVLSGLLGAGKTTTLNHVLRASDERDLAVLVNDMGEVNVDAELVAESSDIADEDEELIELSNGCICCELRGDLLDAIGGLTAADREFDAIVVESTGVAEPLPVAQTLTLGFDQSDLDPTEFYEETGIEPLEGCHLDTTVTVVDAHQFRTAMESDELLDDDGTEKHLGDLVVEQVEFCDVLLVNKCDLVDEETLEEIESTLEVLQPRAEIVRTEHGRVDPDAIVDTDRFDFEAASQSAGWIRELQEPHASAEEEHGVTSFVFEARRPFHPERFADLLDEFPDAVVRSKGHFWLASSEDERSESSKKRAGGNKPVSRQDQALTLNVAGQSIRVGPGGRWVASLPEDERREHLAENPELEAAWHERWGDRNVRLVLIGTEMDHESLRGSLEDCLVTDAELEAGLEGIEDRFPTFEPPEEDVDEDDDSAADAAADQDRSESEELGIAD
ncbi:GTP-binding protein [Natronolimnohabitans innermongolicus]|uniref:Cobalamin synthesis protein P47K n=1 Tax=Natronolimnohabitans innermongolicus JCM 12255 TaxID=1227499 RepID=L9XAA2_9EURY|nr:GTP-binding protein [Natronolimnohabitans innermongolicus]ELY58645.1 cobalamin synthesis protein P47K [Natronolimnohabitans innermongolicus JCM 12255]